MTIIQLEYLLAVANCGSFSQASEVCFVTQPSLSMQIKNLEEELGVILLDRTKKPVIPTEAGNVVIQNAREAIKAYNYVKESVNELKSEVTGSLHLGVIPSIAPYLLHKFIPDFVSRYPKVNLEIREMITRDIVKALEHDALDAAILAGGTCPDTISEDELFNDIFYAYVSPNNRLYERSNIRIEDIDMRELLLLSDGHCLRDQIIELCQMHKAVQTSCSFESGSLDTLMRIVDCTGSMTIIPEMATPYVPEERRSQIKMLAKGAASRKIAIAVRRTYVKSSIIAALKASILGVAPIPLPILN
jgi:LysR family hydrogen peroxide-inducible transcriptional activator